MSRLSILGAQRVKALSEMIDEQCRVEIAKESKFLTTKEAIEIALNEKELKKYNKLLETLHETISQLNSFSSITGENYGHSRSANRNSVVTTLLNSDMKEKRAKQAEIKAEHDKRKQLLWLCETLDEAKQIVGI